MWANIGYMTDKERDERVDWDKVFDGFNSSVDLPSNLYYKSLLKYYPNAKFILTERNPETWYDSINRTILHTMHPDCLRWLYVHLSPFAYYCYKMDLNFWNYFGGREKVINDKEHTIKKMHEWNAEVRNTIPASQLLIWKPREGWD
eukprot:UN23486